MSLRTIHSELQFYTFVSAHIIHNGTGAIEHILDAVELKMDSMISAEFQPRPTHNACAAVSVNNTEIAYAPRSTRVIDTVEIIII